MSSDPNRPRPRSSKKRRAVQSGTAARPSPGPRGSGSRRPAGGTSGGAGSGGLSTPMLAVIAVVVFGIGVALAGGLIKFGSDSSNSATASHVARGTNCPTSQPPAAAAGENRVATIETAEGTIALNLSADLSPIAVGNFEALATCGYYDGIVFHRIVPDFVIQGGDPTGTGTGGPGYTIKDEPVTATYGRGTVAMARSAGRNTVGSQFFIVLSDQARAALAQANTYQIIGTVASGMETVDAIAAAANGVELPADPVVMTKVTIGPPVSSSPAPGSVAPTPSAAPSSPSEAPSPSAAPSAVPPSPAPS